MEPGGDVPGPIDEAPDTARDQRGGRHVARGRGHLQRQYHHLLTEVVVEVAGNADTFLILRLNQTTRPGELGGSGRTNPASAVREEGDPRQQQENQSKHRGRGAGITLPGWKGAVDQRSSVRETTQRDAEAPERSPVADDAVLSDHNGGHALRIGAAEDFRGQPGQHIPDLPSIEYGPPDNARSKIADQPAEDRAGRNPDQPVEIVANLPHPAAGIAAHREVDDRGTPIESCEALLQILQIRGGESLQPDPVSEDPTHLLGGARDQLGGRSVDKDLGHVREDSPDVPGGGTVHVPQASEHAIGNPGEHSRWPDELRRGEEPDDGDVLPRAHAAPRRPSKRRLR
jgi:hypothetical protein